MCLEHLIFDSLESFSHVRVDGRLAELDTCRFAPLCFKLSLDDLLANLFVVSHRFGHVEEFNAERIEHLSNLLLMRHGYTGIDLRQDRFLISGQHRVLYLVQDFAGSLYNLILECEELSVSFSCQHLEGLLLVSKLLI